VFQPSDPAGVQQEFKDQGPTLSRFGIGGAYRRFRQAQLRDWMLYLVDRRGVETRDELIAQARLAHDFQRVPAAEALGLVQSEPEASECIAASLSDLLERGWLVGEGRLSATEAGKAHLRSSWGRWIGRLPAGGLGTWPTKKAYQTAWQGRCPDQANLRRTCAQ
jgi:hypothetical protein